MIHRIHNFCAGPCTLPLSILEQAQEELLNFRGSGMGAMEVSHRSKIFEPMHNETVELAGKLLGMPEDFQCLLLPGGATGQFAMTAMNLLADGGTAGIINSGIWAEKAFIEAKRIGKAEEVWSGKDSNFTTLPAPEAIRSNGGWHYIHLTSNETIGGIQFPDIPTSLGVPLVIDASSDYYTRSIPWDAVDIVYGGAQKNLAPSGFAVVFVRKSCIQEHPHLPKFLTYKPHADNNSLYNTPPTWQIYILNLMLHWMQKKGGVDYFASQAQAKSAALYAAIDASDFYQNNIAPTFRSKTNVIFRTPTPELDTEFWQRAEKEGLSGLKGHRIVGGLRASLYNAMEMDGVQALISYMAEFARTRG